MVRASKTKQNKLAATFVSWKKIEAAVWRRSTNFRRIEVMCVPRGSFREMKATQTYLMLLAFQKHTKIVSKEIGLVLKLRSPLVKSCRRRGKV